MRWRGFWMWQVSAVRRFDRMKVRVHYHHVCSKHRTRPDVDARCTTNRPATYPDVVRDHDPCVRRKRADDDCMRYAQCRLPRRRDKLCAASYLEARTWAKANNWSA